MNKQVLGAGLVIVAFLFASLLLVRPITGTRISGSRADCGAVLRSSQVERGFEEACAAARTDRLLLLAAPAVVFVVGTAIYFGERR